MRADDKTGWTQETPEAEPSGEIQRLAAIENGTLAPDFSPPATIRRGSARAGLIFAVLLGLGRLFLWHGAATSSFVAILLGVLAMCAAFSAAQSMFGLAINELYQSFWRISNRQKMQYIAIIAVTVGLLCLFCALLFPGIGDRL